MRSSISLGLVSGLIGHFVKCIVLYEPRHTHRRKNHPPHHFANIMSGAILGIPLVHFMKKTGKDKYISKGASFGMLLWAFFYGARNTREHYHLKRPKYHSELLSFFSYVLFGVTTAYTAVKLADPGTYSDDEYDFGF